MNSTLTAGDIESEDLQRIPAGPSLESATPRTQAIKNSPHSITQDSNNEDVQIREPPKLDVAPEPPEAARASAQADTKEDGHISTDDTKDDFSIASDDLDFVRVRPRRGLGKTNEKVLLKRYRRNGAKHARTTATYIETLENRVMTVERELLELQYEVGSKATLDEERQVECSIPHH